MTSRRPEPLTVSIVVRVLDEAALLPSTPQRLHHHFPERK